MRFLEALDALAAPPPSMIALAAGTVLLALALGYAIAAWWLRPEREVRR